jgi:uncharacterized protein (DUF2141 family)
MLAVAAAAMLPAAAPVSDVTVAVSGLRSDKGVVRGCMTTDPQRFPRCVGDPAAHRVVVPAELADKIEFRNVVRGRYAIALLHDENGNGKADRALSMIPKEGFGFSRDAPVRMGPPKFSDASFTLGAGDSVLPIRMRYML